MSRGSWSPAERGEYDDLLAEVVASSTDTLTVPIVEKPPWWRGNPARPAPSALGDCPECGERVTDLSGSPRDYVSKSGRLVQRAHLTRCIPCGCWLLPEEADELGRD